MTGEAIGMAEESIPVRYWQISPGENARLWDDFRQNSIVGIGYDLLDFDLSGKPKDEIFEIFRGKYPHFSEIEARAHTNILWNFMSLRPGDKFVVSKSKGFLAALGGVKGNYRFNPERKECKHTVGVEYSRVSAEGTGIPEELRGKF
ncbi:MAG: hypothetical protein NTY64_14600, partial [Deltaproteobacteria bacterium]|nr:hypothetical protein [Deltaproteobacteria bacterium]